MVFRSAKIAIVVSTITIILFIAIVVVEFYPNNPPTPQPFAFNLSTNPNNVTVLQAQNLTLNIAATYLEGNPETVTFSAGGGPNGTLYQFSNQTGTPTQTRPFTSNLTIHIPQSASSGVYLIDLASNASTQTSHVPFNLTVLNAEIQVFGNVTIDSKVYLEGVTLDVIPTHIVFKSNTTGETYQAKVHRFTDTDVAPGRTGNYSIMLPNQQNYHVEFLCFTFDHFIPVARVASNVDRGHYTVSCGVGVNSVMVNFIG